MQVIVSSQGSIQLPETLRRRDQIRPGDRFAIKRLQSGQYLLKRVRTRKNEGLIDWLLSCPEKGWFEPVSCESTDTL